MFVAGCPECDAEISLKSDVRVGRLVRCPECDTQSEVTSLYPPLLGWSYYEDDDDEEMVAPRMKGVERPKGRREDGSTSGKRARAGGRRPTVDKGQQWEQPTRKPSTKPRQPASDEGYGGRS